MAKGSDNVFPKVLLGPIGAPTAPSDASWKLYAMANGIFAKSSNSTVGPFGTSSSGGTPSFVGVRGIRTTAQTITTATVTAIAFNGTDTFDTHAFHDPASNNSRFVVPSGKDGYYLAIATLQWDVSTAGARLMSIRKNGTTLISEIEYNPNFTPVDGQGASLSTIVLLAATDYLELTVYHTKGTNLDTRAAAEGCNFQMTLLGT